jgi:hypothetical protein
MIGLIQYIILQKINHNNKYKGSMYSMIVCSIDAEGLTCGKHYVVYLQDEWGVYIYDDFGRYRYLSADNYIKDF